MKKVTLIMALLTLLTTPRADAEVYNTSSCCGGGSFEIGADWLYWKAFQDDLEYAFANTGTFTSPQLTALAPNFKANSGFRVFGEYILCDNSWKFGAIYTRLYAKASNDSTLSSNVTLLNTTNFPIFLVLPTNSIFSNFSSSWEDTINYFDLDIAREFCLCPCLAITPHMGLRGVWRREKFNINGTITLPQGALVARFHEQFDGYGVEGGLHGHLRIGCGFSLVGHVGGSLLYARIKTEESANFESLSIVFNPFLSRKIFHISPMLDTFIGLEYQRNCWCYPVELHLGWEQHIIMNSSHLSTINYSDLTLQGLTLGASVRF